MNLDTLNHLPDDQFLAAIGGPLEGETWLAARVIAHRPFATREALIDAFEREIAACTPDEKVRLLESHPELAAKVELSPMSVAEQAAAGLKQLTNDEYDEFMRQNRAYRERFGFGFVICARENTKHTILAAFGQRLTHPRDHEIALGAGEVFKILRLRLIDLVHP
jgi:OHCU decarboxylase